MPRRGRRRPAPLNHVSPSAPRGSSPTASNRPSPGPAREMRWLSRPSVWTGRCPNDSPTRSRSRRPARARPPAAAQSITLPPDGDNQRSEVTQQIGLVTVSVAYGSPDVHAPNGDDRRGKIFGTLVPYGIHDLGFNNRKGPWRAGANENTVFTVSHPVTIQGQPLPAGRYGLHMLAGAVGVDGDLLEELDLVGQLQLRPGRGSAAGHGDAREGAVPRVPVVRVPRAQARSRRRRPGVGGAADSADDCRAVDGDALRRQPAAAAARRRRLPVAELERRGAGTACSRTPTSRRRWPGPRTPSACSSSARRTSRPTRPRRRSSASCRGPPRRPR